MGSHHLARDQGPLRVRKRLRQKRSAISVLSILDWLSYVLVWGFRMAAGMVIVAAILLHYF